MNTVEKRVDFPSPKCGRQIMASVKAAKKTHFNWVPEQKQSWFDKFFESKSTGNTRQSSEVFDWDLYLDVPGSDGRHARGKAIIPSHKIDRFRECLLNVQSKAKKLDDVNTESELVIELDCPVDGLYLNIVIKDNQRLLRFWLPSSGKYAYARDFKIDDIDLLIESLQKIVKDGEKAVSDLKLLSDL